MEILLFLLVNANKSHLFHRLPWETSRFDKQIAKEKALMVDFQENPIC
jgi:hypothetical protein